MTAKKPVAKSAPKKKPAPAKAKAAPSVTKATNAKPVETYQPVFAGKSFMQMAQSTAL